MFIVAFPGKSLFLDAEPSVNSADLLVEIDCLLQNIKEFSSLDNVFVRESVLKICI